jgi:hypothetical protein
MKTSNFRLLLVLTPLLIVTQLSTRAAPAGPAAHPAPFVQEHVLTGIDDVVGVTVQQPDRPITGAQA